MSADVHSPDLADRFGKTDDARSETAKAGFRERSAGKMPMGGFRDFSSIKFPIRDRNGELIGIGGIVADDNRAARQSEASANGDAGPGDHPGMRVLFRRVRPHFLRQSGNGKRTRLFGRGIDADDDLRYRSEHAAGSLGSRRSPDAPDDQRRRCPSVSYDTPSPERPLDSRRGRFGAVRTGRPALLRRHFHPTFPNASSRRKI